MKVDYDAESMTCGFDENVHEQQYWIPFTKRQKRNK